MRVELCENAYTSVLKSSSNENKIIRVWLCECVSSYSYYIAVREIQLVYSMSTCDPVVI